MGLEATGLDLTPAATLSVLWVLQKCRKLELRLRNLIF